MSLPVSPFLYGTVTDGLSSYLHCRKDAPANDPGEPGLILAIYGNVLRSID